MIQIDNDLEKHKHDNCAVMLPKFRNIISLHDGRLLGLFIPQLLKFNFWLTEE